jgi:hypothetical protein
LEGGGVIGDGGSRETWRAVTSRKIWRGGGVIGPPFYSPVFFSHGAKIKDFSPAGCGGIFLV